MIKYTIGSLLISLLLTAPAIAQLEPASADANLYFPHLTDGGPADGAQWQTVLTFTNPSTTFTADISVRFLTDTGGPLNLDFGSGAASEVKLSIPAHGIRVLKSHIGPQTVTGWAIASSSVPITGMVTFRRFMNGHPDLEVADMATKATITFTSFASRWLAVAVANVHPDVSETLAVIVRDSNGATVGTQSLTLPPHGHTAFNLLSKFDLPQDFAGTVSIVQNNGSSQRYFIPLALNVSEISTSFVTALPPGEARWPTSHPDRIWKVFVKLIGVAQAVFPDAVRDPIDLRISQEPEVNAFASGDGKSIQVNLATSEIIADSESELAFVVAHELAHILQIRLATTSLFFSNQELDADAIGALLLIGAAYDPYAAGGVLGKLQMASGAPGLLGEAYREVNNDPHKSFATRIQSVFQTLTWACSASPDAQASCNVFKSVLHPHIPPTLPLGERASGSAQ